MANETIELLKNWTPDKMAFPALLSEKLDGVPVRLVRGHGKGLALTRQGEEITSIKHITDFYEEHLSYCPGVELVGELYIRGESFKDISGKVRAKKPSADLVMYVFDMFPNYGDDEQYRNAPYRKRMEATKIVLEDIAGKIGMAPEDMPIQLIPYIVVEDEEAALLAHEAIMRANPNAEGSVVHSATKPFQPGKRCWGTQRLKPTPTIDLEIVGFCEAQDEAGKPLGMVGRVIAAMHQLQEDGTLARVQIGVGPGKLTHKERKALWLDYKAGAFRRGQIAEIKYMRDEAYDALRQPTFQRWRPDKVEADRI
ncbi:hypothetical protein HW532_20935 [Kaustia mangrovi]|uniref:ATP-dependent DNA ligase family profile domain-containing protein n=1 Tax=Kaustia mangrovi TaxID=2593653 RepID=A0A7S8C836_9HYPH|nr:hypothetical protein [Kaustia mangrovi]QPC44946.1 hypothetical protein HW532_20935 [Kaustia mangrovi]